MPFCKGKIDVLNPLKEQIYNKLIEDKHFLDIENISKEEVSKRYSEDSFKDEILAKFVKNVCSADPSSNKGFAGWITESYLDGCITSLVDLPEVYRILKKFMKFQESFDKYSKNTELNEAIVEKKGVNKESLTYLYSKDNLPIEYKNINFYCGLTGKTRPVQESDFKKLKSKQRKAPFTQMLSASLKGKGDISLSEFIQFISPFSDKSNSLYDIFDKFTKDIVYIGPKTIVVVPKSEDSAVHFGGGTKWCTSALEKNAFKSYNRYGPLYILINRFKNTDKYQMQPAQNDIRNSSNEIEKIDTVILKFPDAFEQREDIIYFNDKPIIINKSLCFAFNYNEVFKSETTWKNDLYHNIKFVENAKSTIDCEYDVNATLTNKLLVGYALQLTNLNDDINFLEFDYFFNQSLNGVDLKNVKMLKFNDYFNQPVDGLDLKNVKTLKFGKEFNQPVDGLNLKNVECLEFGDKFNQPVDNLNLENVKSLTFGMFFDQKLDKLDLKNVTSLTIGDGFNQSLASLNLKNVTSLIIKHQITIFNNHLLAIDKLDLSKLKHLSISYGDITNYSLDWLYNPNIKLDNLTIEMRTHLPLFLDKMTLSYLTIHKENLYCIKSLKSDITINVLTL